MDSAAELNLELIESNKEEKQEQIGRDENPSAEDILKQIQTNFGDSVANAFQEQDATQLLVIKELLTRDAESGIFEKLQLNFGKAVRFKALFAHHLPPAAVTSTGSNGTPSKPAVKPTMGQLSSFDPALRHLYLAK